MDVLQHEPSTVPVLAHYDLVAPLLERLFGAIPVVAVSFPHGFSATPQWHGPTSKPLPKTIASVQVDVGGVRDCYVGLSANALLWLCHRDSAVEFHSWTPTANDPLRLRFARILLELDATAAAPMLDDAARAIHQVLVEREVRSIPVLAGARGMGLWLPFCDAPEYAPVRAWLHEIADEAVRRAPSLLTTDPNVRNDDRVHVHVGSNAPRRFSALPYTLRGDARLSVCAPLQWDEVGKVRAGSIGAAGFAERFHTAGEVFGAQVRIIDDQRFSRVDQRVYPVMTTPSSAPERGHVLNAVLAILSDGHPRSADEILAEAIKNGTLPPHTSRKYVYTALIEYIARTEGRKRKPLIVQDDDRRFRINEPPDPWPAIAVPQPPPAPGAEELCARLSQTSHGDDPAAFERAVCDAFTMLGFRATHLGGNDAPDGYADAVLGPLQYRVMLECKTARSQVTQPDCFEASKYRDAYGAQYCTIVGPDFPGELEFTSELQQHGVSAWTVRDLQQLLGAGATAVELRDMLAPGLAADRVGELLWARQHGSVKRLTIICSYLRSEGWQMQLTAAQGNARSDAASITADVAIALVDAKLAANGTHAGCSRAEIAQAFAYLTSPLVAAAAWADESRVAIVIVRPR